MEIKTVPMYQAVRMLTSVGEFYTQLEGRLKKTVQQARMNG